MPMNEELIPVAMEEVLRFRCGKENGCFSECCRNINQCLMPYDILRLKNRLGMTSGEFLKTYTWRHTGPESGLPMIELKHDPSTGYACPFSSGEGCSVYADRPVSCRLYPLARGVARSREDGAIREYYAVIRESHCRGFDGGLKGTTIRRFVEDQGALEYNAMNDKLMEIISLKNRIMPGKLEGAQADLFYMAVYDLDTFRDRIFNHGLLEDAAPDREVMERIREDDGDLLDFGLAWIKDRLFGIRG